MVVFFRIFAQALCWALCAFTHNHRASFSCGRGGGGGFNIDLNDIFLGRSYSTSSFITLNLFFFVFQTGCLSPGRVLFTCVLLGFLLLLLFFFFLLAY